MIELLHEFHDALGRLLKVLDNPGTEKRLSDAEHRFLHSLDKFEKVMYDHRRKLASQGNSQNRG